MIVNEGCTDKVYQRIPDAAVSGLKQGGRYLVEGTLIARRNEGPYSWTAKGIGPHEQFRVQREYAKRQIADLKDYAQQNGIWSEGDELTNDKNPNYDHVLTDEGEDPGGESLVWTTNLKDNKGHYLVEKLISDVMYVEPVLNFDRIALFNYLSPCTAMEVIGLGEFKDSPFGDDFYIKVRQPFVIGRPASFKQTVELMKMLGFTTDMKLAEELDGKNKRHSILFTNADKSIAVTDLHSDNVVALEDGTVVMIDADIRLFTDNARQSGNKERGKYIIPPLDHDVAISGFNI